MPVFISYSHKDKEFVDKLAINLVQRRHHIWMDRWELNVGDSLIDKVQTALTKSSAILLIISKNSLESQWFKKELNAGLVRELEERKTLIIPCKIDESALPIFLREKMYADFALDADAALASVDNALAAISNPQQGRLEDPQFFTDWSVDWATAPNGELMFEWTFVDHAQEWPYIVLSSCRVFCNATAKAQFKKAESENRHFHYLRDTLAFAVAEYFPKYGQVIITDAFPKQFAAKLLGLDKASFDAFLTCRRLGLDNGKDTIVHLDNNFRRALREMTDKLAGPKKP